MDAAENFKGLGLGVRVSQMVVRIQLDGQGAPGLCHEQFPRARGNSRQGTVQDVEIVENVENVPSRARELDFFKV